MCKKPFVLCPNGERISFSSFVQSNNRLLCLYSAYQSCPTIVTCFSKEDTEQFSNIGCTVVYVAIVPETLEENDLPSNLQLPIIVTKSLDQLGIKLENCHASGAFFLNFKKKYTFNLYIELENFSHLKWINYEKPSTDEKKGKGYILEWILLSGLKYTSLFSKFDDSLNMMIYKPGDEEQNILQTMNAVIEKPFELDRETVDKVSAITPYCHLIAVCIGGLSCDQNCFYAYRSLNEKMKLMEREIKKKSKTQILGLHATLFGTHHNFPSSLTMEVQTTDHSYSKTFSFENTLEKREHYLEAYHEFWIQIGKSHEDCASTLELSSTSLKDWYECNKQEDATESKIQQFIHQQVLERFKNAERYTHLKDQCKEKISKLGKTCECLVKSTEKPCSNKATYCIERNGIAHYCCGNHYRSVLVKSAEETLSCTTITTEKNSCRAVIKSGERKGQICGKKCRDSTEYCGNHRNCIPASTG